MDITRRDFLKYAAVGGTAMITRDGKDAGRLVPYVIPPENLSPVEWNIIATVCRECPAGCGMHIRQRDGRVTKAEGNPLHPVSRGGLCGRGQSALQGIYDPDRVRDVQYTKRSAFPMTDSWENALGQIGNKLRKSNGRVAMLSGLETGTTAEIMSRFLKAFGSDRLLYFEAFNYEPARKAHAALFRKPVIPFYHLDRCEYIISFGADFLETWVSNVQFARQFAQMRELKNGKMGRFVYVGPRRSMTAYNADQIIHAPPGREKSMALALLKIIHEKNPARNKSGLISSLTDSFDLKTVTDSLISEDKLRKIAHDFATAKGSIALACPTAAAGSREAEELALITTVLNHAVGSYVSVADLNRPHAISHTAYEEDFRRFLNGLSADDLLIIHRTNPVYSRPWSRDLISRAGTIVYCGMLRNETAAIADWILPVNDELESWGDYEPYPGIVGLIQPTMKPFADSMQTGDVLLKLADNAGKPLSRTPGGPVVRTAQDWLKARWRSLQPKGKSDQSSWEESLRRGGVWPEKMPLPSGSPGLRGSLSHLKISATGRKIQDNEAHLWLWTSVLLFDGRTSNRGWIQENPEPVDYCAWGTWLEINPQKAKRLGIKEFDVVQLASGDVQVEAVAIVTDVIEENTVGLMLGQGHTSMGKTALKAYGPNGFLLHTSPTEGYFGRVVISRTGRQEYPVIYTFTKDQHDRNLLQWVEFEEAKDMKPGEGKNLILPLPQGYIKTRDVYPPHYPVGHRWAMVVDLQRCIGCQACAVACYAENNIPVVGRDVASKGHQQAWLKVVPYQHPGSEKLGWLPMPCQHCDSAPCEPVCPVFASVHNEEGLNAQIYNRCIGTRYCDNNCPYKVRRFNWHNYEFVPPLDWQLNPEVTVRCRGVMEKCTFCVQRIRNAEYKARIEDRKIPDGEIQPACVQSCPTGAYKFGDLLDPDAEVTKLTMKDPRRYHVLEHLNTKPAVAYLKRIYAEKEI